ncbi:hypothetical protein JTE90_009655 [Oedothorax gibbosus]|uniref:BED-type domain-containing protein n=1 Tax=Oedothorax gibbosus TaxID=931172 RepID=A0AAV6TWD3_9ARAC|nr:hypothetical protein JTE90_009655 [Oedothorax gibbosus]
MEGRKGKKEAPIDDASSQDVSQDNSKIHWTKKVKNEDIKFKHKKIGGGPVQDLPVGSSPFDFFKLFFTLDMCQTILMNTNKYDSYVQNKQSSHSSKWKPIEIETGGSTMNTNKSLVWSVFKYDDAVKVKCNLCSTFISRGGTGKKASTTPLLNHIRTKHTVEYDKHFSTKKTSYSANDDVDDPDTSSRKRFLSQPTLASVLEKKKL